MAAWAAASCSGVVAGIVPTLGMESLASARERDAVVGLGGAWTRP